MGLFLIKQKMFDILREKVTDEEYTNLIKIRDRCWADNKNSYFEALCDEITNLGIKYNLC